MFGESSDAPGREQRRKGALGGNMVSPEKRATRPQAALQMRWGRREYSNLPAKRYFCSLRTAPGTAPPRTVHSSNRRGAPDRPPSFRSRSRVTSSRRLIDRSMPPHPHLRVGRIFESRPGVCPSAFGHAGCFDRRDDVEAPGAGRISRARRELPRRPASRRWAASCPSCSCLSWVPSRRSRRHWRLGSH